MKVLSVFGTRPEAIKMAPVVKALKQNNKIESKVCVTGQHREILDQVLDIFSIKPDFDLDIFSPGQTLTQITNRALLGMEKVLLEYKPDLLLIQGDTTTVFTGALAAFYHRIPVGHVEAGLRSGNIYSPFPEEANRKLTGILADLHFAPTERARENLIKENYDPSKIFVTGNTVIDSLKFTVKNNYVFDNELLNGLQYKRKVILLTSHRRENWGQPMENIFKAMRHVLESREDIEIVFPMHPNPIVRNCARPIFEGMDRIHLIDALSYADFCNLMAKVDFIVSDSGGVQEEAPTLGKPVIVLRENTERPEGIEAGTAKLVGTDEQAIIREVFRLLDDEKVYNAMASALNPYGDGHAAERIVNIIQEHFL